MASIRLKNVKKEYPGGVVAVHDFNLDIEDREFIVLVGPSGCGKSTTLRMIAGLEEITSGELYIGDRLVNQVEPKDRDIAMVFQNYALYPHMTVEQNMAFALELRKMPKDEIKKKVLEAANILGIEDMLSRKPKALSGGQRQRVALGRAIVRDPAVFLFDEPLSNLDAKLRAAMRAEITLLHNSLGTTFVYVTHDQVEAMTMGDRIVVMKDGYIHQIDTPQALYDKPCNLFVAGFIGSPQMNFLDATVERSGNAIFARLDSETALLIPDENAGRLEPYVGKQIILGIRPEHVYAEDAYLELLNGSTFSATVEVCELLGSDTYLYVRAPGTSKTFIARVLPITRAVSGQKITLAIDPRYLHYFDKETESAI